MSQHKRDREALDQKETRQRMSPFIQSLFTWFSLKALGEKALKIPAQTAVCGERSKFGEVFFFTFTYLVPMALSFQNKKENTSAPAAAGPGRLQTQWRDAGVAARRPAHPGPHRAPPPCPGSETPDHPADSGGLHRGPRGAERRSQRPSRTVSPGLRPGSLDKLRAGRVNFQEQHLEPAVDLSADLLPHSPHPRCGSWGGSAWNRCGPGMILKEQRKWDPLNFLPRCTALAPSCPGSSAHQGHRPSLSPLGSLDTEQAWKPGSQKRVLTVTNKIKGHQMDT